MRVSKRARWALVIVAALALVLAATAAARTHSAAGKKPIVIGWAYDGSSGGPMNPFDAPALAAAKIEIAKVDKKGVDGRKIVLKTCNTQGDKAADSTACAAKLISEGANIMFTTCDVNLATPVVQPAINKGLLTIAPCIGTDQMGPKQFGEGQARLQLRQRRAGRRLGDGPGRLGSRLEDRGPRHGQRDRLLQGGREPLQGSVHAARRQDQLRDDVSGPRSSAATTSGTP